MLFGSLYILSHGTCPGTSQLNPPPAPSARASLENLVRSGLMHVPGDSDATWERGPIPSSSTDWSSTSTCTRVAQLSPGHKRCPQRCFCAAALSPAVSSELHLSSLGKHVPGESRAALAGAGSTALPLSSCFGSWQQPPGEVGHAWRPPGARAGRSHCPRHDSAAPEVGAGEGAVGGRWWGRCEVTRPAHFGWAHTQSVPAAGSCPSQLLHQCSPGAPAHLARETEAEKGFAQVWPGRRKGDAWLWTPIWCNPHGQNGESR